MLAAQPELVARLNRWIFEAAAPGDVAIVAGRAGDGAAAARCANPRHPVRDSIALIGGPAAMAQAALLEVTRGRDRPAKVRIPDDQPVLAKVMRDAGFREAGRCLELWLDAGAPANRAAAGAVTVPAGLRVGPADPASPPFVRGLGAHYAAVHEWDPPSPWSPDDVVALLLADADRDAAHAAWRDDDGELVGVSLVHGEGEVAYCGPVASAPPGEAAAIASVLLARRVLASNGRLLVEVDVGDGANRPLERALVSYRTEPAGPDVLVFVSD